MFNIFNFCCKLSTIIKKIPKFNFSVFWCFCVFYKPKLTVEKDNNIALNMNARPAYRLIIFLFFIWAKYHKQNNFYIFRYCRPDFLFIKILKWQVVVCLCTIFLHWFKNSWCLSIIFNVLLSLLIYISTVTSLLARN